MKVLWFALFLLVCNLILEDYDVILNDSSSSISLVLNTQDRIEGFTFCLWIRLFDKKRQRVIASFQQQHPSDFKIVSLVYHYPVNIMQLWINNQSVDVSVPNLFTGEWHHTCAGWNTTHGRWKVMVDGDIQGACNGLSSSTLFQSPLTIHLGKRNNSSSAQEVDQSFQGQMSSFYFWTRELTLRDMRKMFELCQPEHNTRSTIGWDAFWKNLSETASAPSRCHKRRNLARNTITSPIQAQPIVDGKLASSCYTFKTTKGKIIEVELKSRALISEVFISLGSLSVHGIQIQPIVSNDEALTSVECGSAQTMVPYQSGVFYCSKPLNGTKVNIHLISTKWLHVSNINVCEVLIFGEYDGALPITIFPMSNNSQEVIEYKRHTFTLDVRKNISFGLGVAGEKTGSSVFGRQSQLIYTFNENTDVFSSGSFSMSVWISIDVLPVIEAHIVGFFTRGKTLSLPRNIATHIAITSKNVNVVFGGKESTPSYYDSSPTVCTHPLYFKKHFWYHLIMTYDVQYKQAALYRDDKKLCVLNGKNIKIWTTNTFLIGSGFIGKIACVQVFDQPIKLLEAGSVFYKCLDGQPATPPPMVFFPFSVMQTLKNVVNVSMETKIFGYLATSSSERTGVLNEPFRAVRFSDNTIKKLQLRSISEFRPKFALSIFCWIMMKLPKSNVFFRQNHLRLKIVNNLYEVELTYKTPNDVVNYVVQGTTNLLTDRWYFISFSFASVRGGSVLLELDDEVEYQEHNLSSYAGSVGIKLAEVIEIGDLLDGKLACVQMYNAWLTNAQRKMAKYKCLDETEEGIYQKPSITSVRLVAPTQAVVSWLKIDYPIRGLIQGYLITYSIQNNHQHVSWNIASCNDSYIILNGLQPGSVYDVSVQGIGREQGPVSQVLNFTVPRVPLKPPKNILANSTSESSIRLTWNHSNASVLGYYAVIYPSAYPQAKTAVLMCSNYTSYDFKELTPMTEYVVKVNAVDSKGIGTSNQGLTVTTDEEAPLNKPYDVRVLNLKSSNAVYVDWQHTASPNLTGHVRGFIISIWLTHGNQSQAKNYSVITWSYQLDGLDVNNNYTAVIYPFTTRVGPGSDPVTNRDEEAIKVPPASFTGYLDKWTCSIRLYWSPPDRRLTFGLPRDYRVTYYTQSEGPQAALQVIVQSRALTLWGLKASQTYALCVAARSIPDTAFGPCTKTLNMTTNCLSVETQNTSMPQPGSNSTSERNNGTDVCSQGCGGDECSISRCPDLLLNANFTEETWNESLADSDSLQFKNLETKIRKNVDVVHEGITDVIKDVKLIKCWQGSVMATINITLYSSSAEEILRLQDWLDVNGGIGHMPLIPTAIYSNTVAGVGPVITSVRSIYSTVVQVTWNPINDSSVHGLLKGYKINYRPSNSTVWQSTNCSSGCLSIIVDFLQPLVSYRFRVQVMTEKGNGIVGPAFLATMPAAASNTSPQHVRATVRSSTVITVEWSHVSSDTMQGTLIGYRVMCIEENTGTVLTSTTHSWIDWLPIENLKKFTWYLIRVGGFSDQGTGASSTVVRVRTWEDVPSAPPSGVILHDMRHISTIDIHWSPVPQEHRNGIILGYRLTISSQTTEEDYVDNNPVYSKTYGLSSDTTRFSVDNLNSSTSYVFEILAYTSIGDGVATKLVGATCNCQRDVYTNWRHYPPYVTNDNIGTPGGILGSVVKDMILTACGECPNGHGRSVIHFSTNGKGKPAKKQSQYDVMHDIDDVTDVSFPVLGYLDDPKFMTYYEFVSLVESPGTAFLVVRKDESTSRNNALFNSLKECWPIVGLSFCLAWITGLLIWFVDCGPNPEQFSPKFHQGAWEGLWFCYISMTTVGYGDRSPVSILARILTLVWILVGLIIISICMSLISSSLTVVVTSLEKKVILYGTKVSAVENSTEYRVGLLKNAKMFAYPSLTSSYQALSSGEVQGVLVDAYVAGSLKAMMPANTYVNRIIYRRSVSYGIVLSGKIVGLQKACKDYLQMNKALISNLIKQNIMPLESSSTVAFNASKPTPGAHVQAVDQAKSEVNVWNVIIHILIGLAACICCGLIWEAYFRVEIKKGEELRKAMEEKRTHLRQVIQQFYQNSNHTLKQLRKSHLKKLKLLRDCKKRLSEKN